MSDGHGRYDIAVIGGGGAGITVAEIAAEMHLRVALIEKNAIGGECTWTGCIPSKALISAAKVAYTAQHDAKHYGVCVNDVDVKFPLVMQYVRETIASVYDAESPAVLESRGIEVIKAKALFESPNSVFLSDGTTLSAKYFVICTGGKPRVPQGFESVPYLTHESLFDLEERPKHLLVVGGGPVGVEMAQAFNRLGSKVTLITDMARLLPNDEPEASELIADILKREGVSLCFDVTAESAEGDVGGIRITLSNGQTVTGSHVLLAVGKELDVSGLKPEKAGIATDKGKLIVNDNLQTSQSHIYAAGDVIGGAQFTHIASQQAFTAIRSIAFPFTSSGFSKLPPWTTFSDPEVAHAGLTEAQAREQYDDVFITQQPMHRADRAMTQGCSEGFMKLIHKRNGKLLGATIVGVNAGEMMNEWVRVIDKGGRVMEVAMTQHIYPTLGVANAILATEQLRHQFSDGWLAKLLRRFVRWYV